MAKGANKIKKPAIAGILMFVAVVLSIVFVGVPVARHVTSVIRYTGLDRFTWFVSPLPFFALAVGFGGATVLSNVLALIYLISIPLAITGGIFVLRGRVWGLAVTGSVGALICTPFIGMVALVLTIMARDDFLQ